MKEKEPKVPTFPALAQCLLIDARHSSRTEISRQLKSSGLFDNIIEAKSVADGMKILASHEVDACFIGSSLSVVKAAEFVTEGIDRSYSDDCAFVAVSPNNAQAAKALKDAGAHSVVNAKSTRKVFTEGVVLGVIKANANSVWVGVVLNSPQSFGLDEDSLSSLRSQLTPSTGPSTGEPTLVASVLASSVIGLESLIEGQQSGKLGLNEKRRPTAESMKAIKSTVSTIFSGINPSKKSEEFRKYFQKSIIDWFRELCESTPEQATAQLKKRLALFARSKHSK